MAKMNPAVRIGPELPEVPSVNVSALEQAASDAPAPVAVPVAAPVGPRNETSEQVSARAKTRTVDAHGFIIESY
jgi:hypothetical protein